MYHPRMQSDLRCWHRAPKGASRCSLARGHVGNHAAYQGNDLLEGELLLAWPPDGLLDVVEQLRALGLHVTVTGDGISGGLDSYESGGVRFFGRPFVAFRASGGLWDMGWPGEGQLSVWREAVTLDEVVGLLMGHYSV